MHANSVILIPVSLASQVSQKTVATVNACYSGRKAPMNSGGCMLDSMVCTGTYMSLVTSFGLLEHSIQLHNHPSPALWCIFLFLQRFRLLQSLRKLRHLHSLLLPQRVGIGRFRLRVNRRSQWFWQGRRFIRMHDGFSSGRGRRRLWVDNNWSITRSVTRFTGSTYLQHTAVILALYDTSLFSGSEFLTSIDQQRHNCRTLRTTDQSINWSFSSW